MKGNQKYRDFIKGVLNRYNPVSEESVSALFSAANIRQLNQGEILLSIGKVSRQIHILYQGAIVSCYLDRDGDVYHKNIFLKGDFVSSTVSSLTSEPSNFALEVIEQATLISFDYNTYKQLINSRKDLKEFYISYLEKNWVIDKEKREIEIVLKEAVDRYIDFIKAHPGIEERIPLRYIASNLGITPTQLSRIRKKLKNSGSNQHM